MIIINWVATHFTMEKDENDNIVGYEALRINVSNHAKKEMTHFYQTLIDLEKVEGIPYAERYIEKFLKEKNVSFNDYMYSLVNMKTLLEKTFN